MSASTNTLVANLKRSIFPASVAGATALAAVMIFNSSGVHASAVTAAPLDDRSVAALTQLDQAMESVAQRVTPAVVNLEVTSRAPEQQASAQGGGMDLSQLPPGFAQFFGQGGGQGGGRMQVQPQQPQVEHGVGSGVIISPDGYIVTNNHVVDGATQIRVTMNDRRIFTGKVVGVDKLTDIAVVKVNAKDLPAISWGDSSKLEPGQTVLAFGSPFGYFRFSVTRGIVSAVNRQNPYSDDARKLGGYIQTDAAINPGNSGGALVNAHGELVGINTFIISSGGSFAGAGFAIPAQIARATTAQLIAHGKVDHGYLGIGMNDVTPDNAHFFNLDDANGAIVAQVTPGSPAGNAGVKQGDVIRQLNGQPISNGAALQMAVSEVSPGTKITLALLRDGHSQSVSVTVGEYGGGAKTASATEDGSPQRGRLGVAVGNLTDDTRQRINAPDNLRGVVIQTVRPGSPAEDAGLQPGDVVLEVNRKPAATADAFVNAVHATPDGKDILLLVWSKGNASYRTVRPVADNASGE